MFPKLKKFLARPARTNAKARTTKDESSGVLPNQSSSLVFDDSFRFRSGSEDENLVNRELHFIVDYLGYCQVSEVQSISLLLESVKRVKKGCAEPTRVDFVIKEGVLKISSVGCHALILTVPLYIVALCAQESLRGFDKCFGVNITRKNAHLCYVFLAGSSLEASSIVQSVALSFKSLGKMLREKKERMKQMRRRKRTPFYKQNSVGSDWSSQSGYNDSSVDPWQHFETWSRVSSITSKGSEQQKYTSASRTAKRSSTYHSFKQEFTALSPVPSNSSSNEKNSAENSAENLNSKTKIQIKRTNSKGEKRKGDFQVDVDVHRELNQKLGRVDRDDAVPLESAELSPECDVAQSDVLATSSVCVDKDTTIDERIEMVLSAIQRGDLDCLASYLDDGVEVDLADSTRRSLLFHAVNYGQTGAVQLLLDRGATVNWEGPNDMSPLHQAAANRDKTIAQILLANGANVRAKDCEFRTPLHMCARHPSGTEMSCILVEHGARIGDNSIDGTRPLDLLPDLKELQSRLVQSVCEAFMTTDSSKSRSNSAASTQSYQSGYSMLSGGSLVAHLGSLRNLYNQSPQLRHARRANSRFTANFDLGSFQWKKDARWMMEDSAAEYTLRKHERSLGQVEEVDSGNRTLEDVPCRSCKTHEHSERKTMSRKSSFRQETCFSFPQHDARHRVVSTDSQAARTSLSAHGLTENIVAEHQGGTFVVGSLDTWAKGSGSEMLLSSTPAEVGICDEATSSFMGDIITSSVHEEQPVTDVEVATKEEHGNSVTLNQSILHHSKTYLETTKGKNKGDSVRFQDSSGPNKETDLPCVGYHHPEEKAPYLMEGKEWLDRCRERTRSNADSCYSSMSPYNRDDDPVLLALSSLVKLSFNPECQPLLLSYLCLPKASSQLSMFAQSPTSGQWVAEAVAILIKNLASIEGPDSRRRAAEAGFIRTILELAEAREPVQITCLEVLDNLLKDVKCEREYNSTMSNIPSGPLLNLLHYQGDCEGAAVGLQGNTSESSDNTTTASKRNHCCQPRELHIGALKGNVLDSKEPSKVSGVEDAPSFCSCRQECSAKLSRRLVATRLLAASSTHLKMQRELGMSRAVTLLLEALEENNEEIVLNATVTLANIAMYDGNHTLLLNSATVEKLKKHIPKKSRAYYYVCRVLVYLDQDDEQCDYLFDASNEEPLPLYTERSQNEEAYIKGGSLETIVRILTTTAMAALWGGVPLKTPSPKGRSRGGRTKGKQRKSRVSDEYVIEFFLATYPTYTNAVVLMRLLIHRFHDPSLDSLFCKESGTLVDETKGLPPLHMALMRIWETWLDKFPEDFREISVLQLQLSNLINTLASYGGPYLVCADHLEDLFIQCQEMASFFLPSRDHCHHDVLFRSCHQAILSGSLPARVDDAIYLTALQLYIEISSLGDQSCGNKVFCSDDGLEKISTSRVKLCLNPAFHKVKNVFKHVRAYYEQISRDAPSQRKAKHDYIDCCQEMVGYGCKFFRVKAFSSCNKSHLNKLLIGVSPKAVILLEGKTKNLFKKWDLKSLLGWKAEESSESFHLLFSESSFQLVSVSKVDLERLQDAIRQCVYERNCEGLNEKDFLPWSKRSEEKRNWGRKAMEDEVNSRLENISKTTRIHEDHRQWESLSLIYRKFSRKDPRFRRHSSASTPKNSRRRRGDETSVTQPDEENPENPEEDEYRPMMAYSVGTLEQKDFETSEFELSSAQKSTTQSTIGHQTASYLGNTTDYLSQGQCNENHDGINCEDDVMISLKLKICLCPPDAELSGFDRSNFTYLQLLHFPRELARQITLIDHELFRKITTADILRRVSEGSSKRRKKDEYVCETSTVKIFSDRFNQLSSWVVASLLKEDSDQNAADMVVQFIETAKQCLELRNYNAVMAIGVGALCSAPVRRLRKARELIPKWYMDQLHIMELLMDSRENHKKYRESLKICPSPAVPYFGVYLKDLIYISEGNPDYLNGGMINLGKRRLLYAVLHQIRRFQIKSYNFKEVPEIQEFLLNTERYTEEELHRMSRKLDTSSRHTISEGSQEVSMSMSAVSLV